MAKPFEKELYKKYDKMAKDSVVFHLNKEGVYTRVVEDYGVDIHGVVLSYGATHLSLHEVEVKVRWKLGLTPWWESELRIPARKDKIFVANPNTNIYFWIVSLDGLGAYRIWGGSVDRVPQERDVGFIDEFFCMPTTKWTYIHLSQPKEK